MFEQFLKDPAKRKDRYNIGKVEKSNNYCFNQFDVKDFFSSKHRSNSDNVITRLVNNLTRAINKHSTLPKIIAVIFDNDIINNCNHDGYGISVHYGIILEEIINEFDRIISQYKNLLPNRCKREYFPHIIWIAPPGHKGFGADDNVRQRKFTDCLLSLVVSAKYYNKMSVLKMVKFWNPEDTSLFDETEHRFTSEGLFHYWLSVDAAVKFWDTLLSEKFHKKLMQQQQ